jgi:hypothetical protein
MEELVHPEKLDGDRGGKVISHPQVSLFCPRNFLADLDDAFLADLLYAGHAAELVTQQPEEELDILNRVTQEQMNMAETTTSKAEPDECDEEECNAPSVLNGFARQ